MEIVVCPNCGANASSEDFTCAACSVILNAAALEDEPVSLVEALLSPTNSGIHHAPAVADTRGADVTVRATVLMDEFTVPHLLVGVEVALQPLHPFEAYVASFIDGRNSVPQIARAAEISNLEAMAILQTLAFRNVVQLDRDEHRLPGLAPELDEEPRTDAEGLSEDELQSVLRANGLAQPENPEELRARLLEAEDFPSLPPPADDQEELPPPMPAASSPALLAGPGALASAARTARTARGTPASGVSSARTGNATPAGGVRGTGFPSPPGGTASAAVSGSRPGVAASGAPGYSRPAGTPSAGTGAVGNSRPGGTPAASRLGGTPPAGSSPSSRAAPRPVPLQDRPAPYQTAQSIEYTLERAISLERRGDLEGAIYVLKKAIAQSKNAAPLYNKLALALVKRREFAEAVSLLEKAVAIAPEEGSYQQNLYKVMGLTASLGKGGKSDKGGVLSKLLGRK
ncbi:MAG: tetratricopeptide repeat protein [Myxococcota bacterium]|nr:tetratricopeptide repeat protein [Myxococcota bacterium]